MDRAASRYGYMDRIRDPKPYQYQSRVHRKRQRQRYEEGYQLRGKDYWKVMGLAALFGAALFLTWWYGGM